MQAAHSAAWAESRPFRALALEYHDVMPEQHLEESGFKGAAARSYKIAVTGFREHLGVIGNAVPVMRLSDDLGQALRSGAAVLTFDDGGVSAIEYIAPMLEDHGWRGAFYVTTDRIGTPGFLTDEQVVELHRRGHLVGSHSCSHPTRMAACSREELYREWRESLARLRDILGAPVTTASVPGGYYSRAVGESAAATGIRVLFTSEPSTRARWEGACLVVGRFTLRRSDGARRVAALLAPTSGARGLEWIKWNGKKVAKAAAGRLYLAIRDAVFRNASTS